MPPRNPRQAIVLSAVEAAYVAGIIDGEGSIAFQIHPVQRRTGRPRMPVLRLSVTNTDRVLIDWLLSHLGGATWTDSKQYIANAKPRHVWQVSSAAAQAILETIWPYLIIKQERASLALRIRGGEYGLVSEVRQLNKKGVA